MTDPANLALVLLCQVEDRKHVSTVYQFQSIETGCQLMSGLVGLEGGESRPGHERRGGERREMMRKVVISGDRSRRGRLTMTLF